MSSAPTTSNNISTDSRIDKHEPVMSAPLDRSNAKTKTLFLYDGECVLCNDSVRFLINRDKHDRLRFAALQSPWSQDLLEKYGIRVDPDSINTVYVADIEVDENNNPHITTKEWLSKTRAWAHTLMALGGIWWIIGWIMNLFPLWLADSVYDLIGSRRYQLFGKYPHCALPKRIHKDKFYGFHTFNDKSYASFAKLSEAKGEKKEHKKNESAKKEKEHAAKERSDMKEEEEEKKEL
eukprot:GEZU01020756.1.p1 GENE.GEZU01020756.1~~GEZU01020756.1.p1  ORF type:complete len:236 (+),score=52.53 GEZU01020756.1:80-787(+)